MRAQNVLLSPVCVREDALSSLHQLRYQLHSVKGRSKIQQFLNFVNSCFMFHTVVQGGFQEAAKNITFIFLDNLIAVFKIG